LTTADVVEMVSGIVYNRRFNSCVDTNILGGIDVNGYGAVFRYDDIGRFKRMAYSVDGPEQEYIENFLLNSRSGGLTKDMIVEILQNAFISATARELETGEQLEILIITSTGVQRVMRDL
jgi:20S proteasome alpha/beta subunit